MDSYDVIANQPVVIDNVCIQRNITRSMPMVAH